jgi:hypothetical protein
MSVSIKISSSTDEIRPHTRWLNAYKSPVHAHVNFVAGECTPSDQTTCREKTPNHRHTSCACLDFVFHGLDASTDTMVERVEVSCACTCPFGTGESVPSYQNSCREKYREKKSTQPLTPLRACLDFVFHGSDSITDTMFERVEVSCACTCPFWSGQT